MAGRNNCWLFGYNVVRLKLEGVTYVYWCTMWEYGILEIHTSI